MAEVLERRAVVNADLHRAADVLYLSLGLPRDDEGEDRPNGIVLRYGISDDVPSGVTVIGYNQFGWSKDVRGLAEIVALHLSIAPSVVMESIELAEKSDG